MRQVSSIFEPNPRAWERTRGAHAFPLINSPGTSHLKHELITLADTLPPAILAFLTPAIEINSTLLSYLHSWPSQQHARPPFGYLATEKERANLWFGFDARPSPQHGP